MDAMTSENRFEPTGKRLKNAPPAERGKRYTVYDDGRGVPDLGVRITDKGVKSFFVLKRLAGNPQPTRITLGRHPSLTLAAARSMAKEKHTIQQVWDIEAASEKPTTE
jgi:hypothetical protein